MRFRLKCPESSFLLNLASPWNFIYKADILAKDMHWYEKNIMGTGPLQVRRAREGLALAWARRTPTTGTRASPISTASARCSSASSSAQVAAIRGERAMIQFRGFSPRRARQPGAGAGQQDHRPGEPVGLHHFWSSMQPREEAVRRQAGAPRAQPRARPLRGLARRCRKITHRQGRGAASRCRARRTRRRRPSWRSSPATGATSSQDARRGQAAAEGGGRPDGFAFTFKNRGIPMPYEPLGIWLIDQWRQIGVNVKRR